MYTDEDILMISGIQHFYYCKRQWSLIHVENQWEDNLHTVKGEILHERVDDPFVLETRGNYSISRSIPLVSYRLGFYGYSDAVEFRKDENGSFVESLNGLFKLTPIEYKVGKPKLDQCDSVQLCVQAICLEEMFKTSISIGYIYYGKTRHRQEVLIDSKLRATVENIAQEMHGAMENGTTFKQEYSQKCDRCSLYNICLPKLVSKYSSVANYISLSINASGDTDEKNA